MAHFNRERVPERNVHAKGSGAFGVFEATEDVSQYTKAALFQPGAKTEMLARFSTVAGEQGSPDTWRDPRGFALKFYTTEGNYDLVGNNTPVFFIRDTMKFPHFIRSQKRLGGSGAARQPHAVGLLEPQPRVGPPGHLPDGRPRHPQDVPPHERLRLAHLHVGQRGRREVLGEVPLPQRPGRRGPHRRGRDRIAGEDADYHRRDLYEAIDRGEFPSWTLSVQVMPYEDAKTYRFNPFDLTKIWPHSDYPLIKVGTMTLNRNPDNFFAQIEQAAFEPSALVPGIGFSPGQDAARAGVRLQRHAPLPDRPELPAAAGQPPAGRRQHLHVRRPDGLRAQRGRPGLRAEHARGAATPT